jgi:hypothetical protein
LSIGITWGFKGVETTLKNELFIHNQLKPIYPGFREDTMPDPDPHWGHRQRPEEAQLLKRYVNDFLFGGFAHCHEARRRGAFVATHLEVNTQLWMSIRIGGRPYSGSDPTQVVYARFTRARFDLITKDQNVDAGENRAFSHDGPSPDIQPAISPAS